MVVSIILFLLKLMGILLLALFGIFLAAAGTVLLVPLRYEIKGRYHNGLAGTVRLTWLLKLFSVTLIYDKDLKIYVRIMGIKVFPGKERKKEEEPEEMVHAMEADATAVPSEIPPPSSAKEKKVSKEAEKEETSSLETGKKEDNRFHFNKILSKLKFSFQKICDKLKAIKDKKDRLEEWIKDKDNQNTVKLLCSLTKRLVVHVMPRKGKGTFTFGFEDPYRTGQLLQIISVIYPFCHKQMEFYPVFDREILEGEADFSGRIRIGTVAWLGVKALMDKNFRRLLKKWLG